MPLLPSQILTTKQLIRRITEANQNGERFCFILGSGASVESGIPSGISLELQWMDCLMGRNADFDTPRMDAGATRELAAKLYEEGKIVHRFDEIERAWGEASGGGKSLPSDYYFDIFRLRFYSNPRSGYRYLEQIMEFCKPSIGYHTLARLLTEDNLNNLVITTNFDSLAEDALFLYTDTRPLVVGHEALADYISSNIQRPIILKVHRGLMYEPFNTAEMTEGLKNEWRDALLRAFDAYAPIVIGYGGGDHSLMSFLKEKTTRMRHGIYWCFRSASGLPGQDIQDLVEEKGGFLVGIDGFDALMTEIGKSLYGNAVTPESTRAYLYNRYARQAERYRRQWFALENSPKAPENEQPPKQPEAGEEKKDGSAEDEWLVDEWCPDGWDADEWKTLVRQGYDEFYAEISSWNGREAMARGDYQEADEEFTKAIERGVDDARDYQNRSYARYRLGQYEKAVGDATTAIELEPDQSVCYINRGMGYMRLRNYKKALENFDAAIRSDPKCADAYVGKSTVYNRMGQYDRSIEECDKALQIKPNFADAYNNRGAAHLGLGQYQEAIDDCTAGIAANPAYEYAYRHRGSAFFALNRNQEAIADFSKAIELNPRYEWAYSERSRVYRAVGEDALAAADLAKAAELSRTEHM